MRQERHAARVGEVVGGENTGLHFSVGLATRLLRGLARGHKSTLHPEEEMRQTCTSSALKA